ncbi:hypothetical protein CYJ28_01865 [Aerococcus sanguinicola]|uniref:Uncharacterized protein n=1 Tax=Aerococcus sanguinicola TaxID=119206 RepID=A0A0X8FC84_9LACT|nr:hypothetical protein AWM72_07885 [Aerococcus sanguinicola]OFT96577.1 hypothetical protein HMPREF3090_02215 [Aerococcus sp. HMSC23C02]PKZ23321.1 hypothetical protein CYJ28_01865 [Aerococcus sanguinicola]
MQKESINLLGPGFLHELIVGIKKRPEQKSSSLFNIERFQESLAKVRNNALSLLMSWFTRILWPG